MRSRMTCSGRPISGTTAPQSMTSRTISRLSANGFRTAATVATLARALTMSDGDAVKIRSLLMAQPDAPSCSRVDSTDSNSVSGYPGQRGDLDPACGCSVAPCRSWLASGNLLIAGPLWGARRVCFGPCYHTTPRGLSRRVSRRISLVSSARRDSGSGDRVDRAVHPGSAPVQHVRVDLVVLTFRWRATLECHRSPREGAPDHWVTGLVVCRECNRGILATQGRCSETLRGLAAACRRVRPRRCVRSGSARCLDAADAIGDRGRRALC